MTAVRIVSLTNPDDVHTIKTHHAKGSGAYEQMLEGIYRKVDFDRYAVEEDE